MEEAEPPVPCQFNSLHLNKTLNQNYDGFNCDNSGGCGSKEFGFRLTKVQDYKESCVKINFKCHATTPEFR